MIDNLTVTQTEHGLVRVFLLIRPLDLARGEKLPPEQVADMLGVDQLNVADVQQIWTDDLVDGGLEELLQSGYGVTSEEYAQHADTIDPSGELHPTIYVIVRSSAFISRPVKLTVAPPLFLLATFSEPDANVSFQPLPSGGAEGAAVEPDTKKRPSDAAMGGRVATVALLVMALLVWVMIKIAG